MRTGHRALEVLTDAGLIDRMPGDRYRVHGLDAERARRGAAARVGGLASGRSRSAERTTNERSTETNLAETSIDEQSRAEQSDGERPDLEAFLLVTRHAPSTRQRALMDAYCRAFDVTGPGRAERLILSHPDDPIGALKADLDAFRRERIEAARASEEPKPQRRRGSGMTGVNAELARLFAQRYAEEAQEPKP
jgi:hypothetical protein